ncbi:MAG: SGNH/GDSL hydrolase family protein [Desulfobulbaceae bacterium]|nr:SGNH/GDSL hydrolase family protein [Desulfobulbaceae bacterium]HIJ77969.1 SGNH/GDSL hydrolase family protein [Deltaproteobacteria bacterium]
MSIRSRKYALLLTIPAFLHLIAFSICVFKYGKVDFVLFDLIFYAFFLIYLGGVLVLCRSDESFGKATLLFYSIIIGVLISDYAIRLYMPPQKFATPWLPMHRVSYASDALPGITGKIELSVNKYGLRGPEVDLKQIRHKILCVGGSTTESLYVTDQKTWPWILQDKLNEKLSDSVFVGNAGRSGHFTLNHEFMLKNYPLVDEFDWVVLLVGINDMGRLLRSDYQELKKRVAKDTMEAKYAYKSSPYYDRMMVNVILSFGKIEAQETQVIQDPEGKWYDQMREIRRKALLHNEVTDIPAGLDPAIEQYKRDLLRIIEFCREKKIKILLVTQPTMYGAGLTESQKSMLWENIDEKHAYSSEVLGVIIDRYNDALLELCKENGVPVIDLARMLPKDISVFYDDCHFNISGSKKVADVLSDYFVSNLK